MSASHLPPLCPGGSGSLQIPRPVLRCRSLTCRILNFPSFLTLGTGFSTLCGGPLRMLNRASGSSVGLSISSAFSRTSQPGRGSTASAPNRTSTAVITFFESLSCRFELRFSQMPPDRDSHFSSPCPASPMAGSNLPIRTSVITFSSGTRSSSLFRFMCTYAAETHALFRYRSFSMRCHSFGSS